MSDTGKCVICEGKKTYLGHTCTFCNGTGEWNQAGENYLKGHICQCITLDRIHCPVCKKICHHNSSQTPKQKIVPGYGGMTSPISNSSSNTDSSEQEEEEEYEELIVA